MTIPAALGRSPLSVVRGANVRWLVLFIALVLNILVAASSFAMVDIISALYQLRPFDAEAGRLRAGATLAVGFSLVPVAAAALVAVLRIRPVAPQAPEPLLGDILATTHLAAALGLAGFGAVSVLLLVLGPARDVMLSGALQAVFATGIVIYTILVADGRRSGGVFRAADWMVVATLVVFALFFVKREMLLLGLPLFAQVGMRVRWRAVIAVSSLFGAVVVFNMLARGNFAFYDTLLRLLGNQYKYLERYTFNFQVYDQCFGLSTIFAFVDRGSYAQFYNLIRDPLIFMSGGSQTWWDSSNLLERLNYAYCSVGASFGILFAFLSLCFVFEKLLNDIRYFRVAFLTIILAFEGGAFYNVPGTAALLLLFASGVWRLVRSQTILASSSPLPQA